MCDDGVFYMLVQSICPQSGTKSETDIRAHQAILNPPAFAIITLSEITGINLVLNVLGVRVAGVVLELGGW